MLPRMDMVPRDVPDYNSDDIEGSLQGTELIKKSWSICVAEPDCFVATWGSIRRITREDCTRSVYMIHGNAGVEGERNLLSSRVNPPQFNGSPAYASIVTIASIHPLKMTSPTMKATIMRVGG